MKNNWSCTLFTSPFPNVTKHPITSSHSAKCPINLIQPKSGQCFFSLSFLFMRNQDRTSISHCHLKTNIAAENANCRAHHAESSQSTQHMRMKGFHKQVLNGYFFANAIYLGDKSSFFCEFAHLGVCLPLSKHSPL